MAVNIAPGGVSDDTKPDELKGPIASVSTNLAVHLSEDVRNSEVLRSARKKIDLRLLVWLSVLHFLMKFAQNNIANAAIMNLEEGDGIKKELGNLSSSQWAWVISIFWYPYMLFEPASAMMVKRYSPSGWFARIFVSWGIVSTCQAATQNYAGILVCRFLLGVLEAGFYPSVVYHLSFWYHPDTLPLRLGINYNVGVSSGAIAGLIAYGVSFMNKTREISGWRWLFILEGIPMILAGILSYFFLTDYPQTAQFLTEEEREAVITHLPPTAPTTHAKFWDTQQVKSLFKDPTLWSFFFLWFCAGIGGFGITWVLPSVIYDLGITGTAKTQLLTMPPYGLAWILVVVFALLVRKRWISAFAAALSMAITQVVCFICLITLKSTYGKYAVLVIACGCTFSIYPVLWPERVRAVEGTTTAAIAFGITNGASCFSGIVGPQIYQTKFGPHYRVSYGVSVAFCTLSATSICISWYLCRKKYAKRALLKEQYGVQAALEPHKV